MSSEIELEGATLEEIARNLIEVYRATGADLTPDVGEPREGIDVLISPTQYDTWSRCALNWFFYKVEEIEREPSEAAALGQAVHKILEAYNQGATMEELFDGKRAQEIATKIAGVFNEQVIWSIVFEAEKLAKTYLEENPRRLDRPEEDRIVYLFSDKGRRFYLRGIVDGRVDHGNGRSALVDYKTTGRKWSQGKAEAQSQPAFYGLLELIETGSTETDLTFEMLLKKPAKCPRCKGKNYEGCDYVGDLNEACIGGVIRFQRIDVAVGVQDIRRALMRIVQFFDETTKTPHERRFFPPSPGLNGVNCAICDYRSECWVKGEGSS